MKNTFKVFLRAFSALALCVTILICSCITPLAITLEGDISADGALNANDLTMLRKALLSMDSDLKYDINGDNAVNLKDLVNLKKKVAYYYDGEKFLSQDLTQAGNAKAIALGSIFGAKEGMDIDSALVKFEVEVLSGDVTYTYNADSKNWADGTVDFNGTGEVNVTICEYCKPTTVKIEVVNETKFKVNETVAESYGNASIITVGTIFSAIEGYEIDSSRVCVTYEVKNGDVTCQYEYDSINWQEGKLEFDGTGEITLTIIEESLPTSVTLTIVKGDKFKLKVDDPYHIYNNEVVHLDSLFEILEGVDCDIMSIDYTIEKVDPDSTLDWTVNSMDVWGGTGIDFTGEGQATITVEEDSNPITITIVVDLIEKLEPIENVEVDLKVSDCIYLGQLFNEIGVEPLDSASLEVLLNGEVYSGTLDYSGWRNTLIQISDEGTYTVTVRDKDSKPATATFNVVYNGEKFAVKFPNTKSYLYRVGNQNEIKLGSLFEAIAGAPVDSADVSVLINSISGNTACTYTANTNDWTVSAVKFTGTGTAEIIIKENCNETVLTVEVVDATNVTNYSKLGNTNSVLLNDITMSSGSSYYLSNAILYGNGFTFDVTNGAYDSSGYLSGNYVVSLVSAGLDNVKLIGAVYTSYGATIKDNYNRSLVLSSGNSTINNCYISNCAAPVRVNGGTIEIANTTLKGGNFANLDIRNGNIVLDNVTTINQVNSNDTATDGTVVVGLGIVVYYENVLNTTTIEVKNGIKQYNHLSKSQASEYITDTTAQRLTSSMFDSAYSAVQYSDGSETWVNTGILSMTSNVGDDNISDVDGYVEAVPTMTGISGYLHTQKPNSTAIDAIAPEYITNGQGTIAPYYSFDYVNKNYVAKTEGSNDYCYEQEGTVYIAMDAGDTFNWDTSIFTATKNGNTLNYSVNMDGTDYTGKTIPFNTSGNYKVNYIYTDANNFGIDENGNIITYEKTYTKTVYISVSVIEAATKHAEFTFGSSNQATEKITVGNNTYISATGVSHNNSTWSYITVSGQKVYYPIVEATIVDKKKAYFNVFKNVVSITDYADGGTGAEIVYNSSTTTMPSGLTVVKGLYKPFADISSNWSTLNDTALTYTGASNVFKYAASSSANSTPTTYNGALAFASPEVTKPRDEYFTIVQYSYTDSTNTTYYYYVGYHMAEKGDGSGCFTPDTLITLADGSKKRVDELTFDDKILAWDFFTGSYVAKNISILVNHGSDLYKVAYTEYSDGTQLKLIAEHGVFDYDLNKYVYITPENVKEFIGHRFVKHNLDGGYDIVTLVNGYVVEEYTEAWSITSAGASNAFASGLLTVAPPDDFYNWIEMDGKLHYNVEQFQNDIETYGLYTYDDFKDYVTHEQFVDWNGAYLKIAVEKGYLTFEYILELIDMYKGWMP